MADEMWIEFTYHVTSFHQRSQPEEVQQLQGQVIFYIY